MAAATGYDAPVVAEQVEEATRAVLEGRAIYERDGTAFTTRPDLPIHAALAPLVGPSSTIADFGGGLGGLFINAPELFPPGCLRLVLEQATMVEAGRRMAAAFGLPIEFLDAERDPWPRVDVLILSGVLQYLPDPWGTLARLLEHCHPRAVIVDRTAVRRGPGRWSVQTNPGYYARTVTYPIQVLDRERLKRSFPGYRLAREWHNSFDAQRPEHIGLLFIRDGESA
ncbi:methyltransferase, TIGR04325 family [Microcystis elabens FACHB-917]|nr:methyltransferase, TIGR04325 family [Microcystis elabens FACHB-917]